MFCNNCGKSVDGNTANFCMGCGADLRIAKPQPQQQVQPNNIPNNMVYSPVQPNYAPNNMGYGQAQPNNMGYGQAQPNNMGYGQAQPNNMVYGQVQPNNMGYGQVQPNYAPNNMGNGQMQPNYAPQQYVDNKSSVESANNIIQKILSAFISIFAVLNAIAVFLPVLSNEHENFFNLIGYGWHQAWFGVVASIFSIAVICCCWESDTVGNPAMVVLAIIVMILDIILYNCCKQEAGMYLKYYKGVGLTFYTIGCVWIPVLAVIKCVIDIVMDKLRPVRTTTHLSHLAGNGQSVAPGQAPISQANSNTSNRWVCSDCGRVNYSYVGSCACGNTKPN